MATLSTSAGGTTFSTPDANPYGNLWQHIQTAYNRALESGCLFKTDSNDAFITDGGVEFVVRVATSLRDKPKPPSRQAFQTGPVLDCCTFVKLWGLCMDSYSVDHWCHISAFHANITSRWCAYIPQMWCVIVNDLQPVTSRTFRVHEPVLLVKYQCITRTWISFQSSKPPSLLNFCNRINTGIYHITPHNWRLQSFEVSWPYDYSNRYSLLKPYLQRSCREIKTTSIPYIHDHALV